MIRRFLIPFLMLILLTSAAVANAAADAGNRFLERLTTAVADGALSEEQALLYQFQYGFEQDAIPAEWRPAEFPPLKCATDIIRRYNELKPTLSSQTVKTIEAYLAPDESPNKAVYLSPLGYFNLTYLTTGANAVSTVDVNPANGVPDYVERCAEYLDTSWVTEIVNMGFSSPTPAPYPISFENMGYYGYTTVTVGVASRIVLHNTFAGFPPNTDPDGNVAGAAKVTCAHEFKHASQLAQSGWSEGGWVELDATWVEDVVFDQVNDFYNYLGSGCGITSPTLSLDNGGTGSYEDAIWQTWMSETWGNQIIIDLWNWRAGHTGQSMLLSYDAILGQNGSSIVAGYPQFAAWNFACGARAITGIGYEEAAQFPHSSVNGLNTYPQALSGSTAHLAAQNYYCYGLAGLTGTLDVDFNGQDGTDLSLVAVIKRLNGTGLIEEITLDANNDAMASLSVPLEEMAWAGVIVVNSRSTGGSATWTLNIDTAEVVANPQAQLGTALINSQLEVPGTGSYPVALSNVGDLGSSLDFTATVMDIDPTAALKRLPAPRVRTAAAERGKDPELKSPDLPAPVGSLYAGDCVFGNNDTGNIQGYYSTWWAGNESYGVLVDPTAAACACGAGFNVRAVHMVLYLQTTSTPQVQAHLMSATAGCGGPGTIIDSSPVITVSAQAAAGYYDIEIPCDFACTDMNAGPYYVVFEFLNAAGPVGIPVDSSPTSCYNFNDWGTGWAELVDGYGFAGDLLIWADVDCCGTASPEVGVITPNGGEFLAAGATANLGWSATVLTDVKVELSRDGGTGWETLYASTPNDGAESWTVTGPSSTNCLLRVSSLDDLYSDVSAASFTIFADVPWLSVAPASGSIPDGASTDLTVAIDGTGLAVGPYTGYVVVASNDPAGAQVITVNLDLTDPTSAAGDAPMVFRVAGNYPNPFNPSTRVMFSLATAGTATVDVLDLQGRVVRTLHQGHLPAGPSSLVWDGRDNQGRPAASGAYLARLRSSGLTATHKMVLAK